MSFEGAGKDDDGYDYSKSNLSEGFIGERVPVSFANGPRKERRCTDICCCLLFIILLGGMMTAVFFYSSKSHIKDLRNPRDSAGNQCGVTEGFEEYPMLFMTKVTEPFRSICVKECPKFDYNQIRYNSSGDNFTGPIQPVYAANFSQAVKDANTSWDGESKAPAVAGGDDPNLYAYDPKEAQGYFTKQQFNAYRKRFELECKTNVNVTTCNHSPEDKVFLYDSREVVFNVCFPVAPRLLHVANFVGTLNAGYLSDIKEGWWIILIAFLICMVIGIIYLIISSYFLGCILWTQIFLTILLLLGLGAISILIATGKWKESVEDAVDFVDEYDAKLQSRVDSLQKNKWILYVAASVFFLIAIIVALLAYCNCQGIKVSIAVLQFSSGFIVRNTLIFLITLFFFILQIFTFFVTIWGFLVFHTSGEVKVSGNGSPFPSYSYDWKKWCLVILAGITVYWTTLFWNNFSDMIAGARTCNYYYSNGTGVFKTFCHVLIYHSGTVAFTSLILFPVTIVQILFGWFYAMFTDDKPNCIQKCVKTICCCFIYPYQKFFNRTSEAGMYMAYFGATNYCPSTKRHHYLQRRVADRIGHVSFIGWLYKISSVFAITALNYLLWSYLLYEVKYFVELISNPVPVLTTIFILSFITSSLFMSLYSTACDAILMCYLIELDLGQTPRHPELSEILKDNAYQQLE